MKAITAREAKRIGEKTGFPPTEGDGRTYYATNEEETELWEYDSKKERDEHVEKHNAREAEKLQETEMKFTDITVDGKPFDSMYEALKEVAKAVK